MRSIWKGPYVARPVLLGKEKIWSRSSTILPNLVGKTISVHNGRKFIQVQVTESMMYRKLGELREQLVINHLVVLNNVFGPEVATRMLFFKMSKDDYSALKTYLLFLSCMPERVRGIKGHDIISSEIPVDMTVANSLRQIK
jgi:small subunit ribosomal protein S19